MDIVRKYLIPVYQAPDAPAPAAVDPAAPPVAPAADPAAAPLAAADPAAPPVVVDPVAADPPAPAEHGNKGKQPWFLARIADETAKRHQTETELVQARREAADARALAERLQAGRDPAAPPLAPQPAAPATRDGPDFQTAVQAEAARQRLYDDSVAIKNAGIGKFGADFGNSLNILTAVGATTDDFITDVVTVDKANAHALLHQLAQDPEKAANLASMNPRARIAELTRMSMATAAPAAADPKAVPAAPAAPAARTVSKAPAPAPALTPSASKVVDGYADDATDEQFTQQFNERMKARAGRR